MPLTLGWTWGKLCLCSTLLGTSDTARSATPILQAVEPVWLSQALGPSPALLPGWMGAATRLSLQGGCVQARDASADSRSPTYRDSRRSKPRELSRIMWKCRNASLSWPLIVCLFVWSTFSCRMKASFLLSQVPLGMKRVWQLCLDISIFVLFCLVFYFLCFFHSFLVSRFPFSSFNSSFCSVSVSEVALAQIPR